MCKVSFAKPSFTQPFKKGSRQSFVQFFNVLFTCAFPISNHSFFLHANSDDESIKDMISFSDSRTEERHLEKNIRSYFSQKHHGIVNERLGRGLITRNRKFCETGIAFTKGFMEKFYQESYFQSLNPIIFKGGGGKRLTRSAFRVGLISLRMRSVTQQRS